MPSQTTTVRTDSEGYLVDPENWNEEVARKLPEKRTSTSVPNTGTCCASCAATSRSTASPPTPASSSNTSPENTACRAATCCINSFPTATSSRPARSPRMKLPRAWSTGCALAEPCGSGHRVDSGRRPVTRSASTFPRAAAHGPSQCPVAGVEEQVLIRCLTEHRRVVGVMGRRPVQYSALEKSPAWRNRSRTTWARVSQRRRGSRQVVGPRVPQYRRRAGGRRGG